MFVDENKKFFRNYVSEASFLIFMANNPNNQSFADIAISILTNQGYGKFDVITVT